MKKLLGLLGSITMIGSASATVVAYGNGSKTQEESRENPTDIARKELIETIEFANSLIKTNNKLPNAIESLRMAVAKAQQVSNKTNATVEELKNASIALEKAIDEFNNSPDNPLAVAKRELQAEILKADALIKNSKKEGSVTLDLMRAVFKARQTLGKSNITEQEITMATIELKTAIKIFTISKDWLDILRDQVRGKIAVAKILVEANEKEAPAVAALKLAIERAEAMLTLEDLTERDLYYARGEITIAIEVYNQAKDKANN